MQLQIDESDEAKVLMFLMVIAGEGQAAAVFRDSDTFIAFTEDYSEDTFELVPTRILSLV
jgi:hypothetical protein